MQCFFFNACIIHFPRSVTYYASLHFLPTPVLISRSLMIYEETLASFLVCDSPGLEPLKVAVFLVWPNHSPRNWHKENVESDGSGVQNTVNDILYNLVLRSHDPIHNEAEVENGKVESWIVVMNVSNTCHGDEWEVVEEPSDDWVDGSVMDLVDIDLLELGVASLPADKVPDYQQSGDTKGSS